MRPLGIGCVLSPLPMQEEFAHEPLVEEACIVLYMNPKLDLLVIIPICARQVGTNYYFRAYRRLSLQAAQRQLDLSDPKLTSSPFVPRSETVLTDADLNARYRKPQGGDTPTVAKLKLRWSLIEPLVSSSDRELLFDPEWMADAIGRRASQLGDDPEFNRRVAAMKNRNQVRDGRKFDQSPEGLKARLRIEIGRLLKQYWAGGSVRGALIDFGRNRGGPGKPKKASERKRGRPNAAATAGLSAGVGMNIEADSDDARTIEYCYSHWVVRGKTVSYCLRQMWSAFYSDRVQDDRGKTITEYWPIDKRPTHAQFVYWGTKNDPSRAAWRRHLPPGGFEKNFRALMGSATDDVFALGQRGALDSTPPDLQLVRATDRLARIGGAHREIVVDSCDGYIAGFYMGLDAPSAVTVRLALWNAFDPDKKGMLDDLGLDLPAEDFLPLCFSNLFMDNTDGRNEETFRCAEGIGTNIHFVPKLRSDLNPTVEAAHHSLHRTVDHNLSGTSYGRRVERGETTATDRARHTLMDAIRETVRAQHFHNTVELKDFTPPIWMKQEGVAPTRVAIARARKAKGLVATGTCTVEMARRHLLPRYIGTFTSKGVRLHREKDGKKIEFVVGVVYVSTHPEILGRCSSARRGKARDPDAFRGIFLVNPMRPRKIWYLPPRLDEQIELTGKALDAHDPDLFFEFALPDLEERGQMEAADRAKTNDAAEIRRAALEETQREANALAEDAYRSAIDERGETPSKASLRRDKRPNREREQAASVGGVPLDLTTLAELDPSADPHPAAMAEEGDEDLEDQGLPLLRAAVQTTAFR